MGRTRTAATEPAATLDPRTTVATTSDAPPDTDAELLRLHPYLMAMFVAYAVGIAFLSRSYIVPTYLLLALVVVYLRMRSTEVSVNWSKPALVRLAGVSCAFLFVSYTFVRLFVTWN